MEDMENKETLQNTDQQSEQTKPDTKKKSVKKQSMEDYLNEKVPFFAFKDNDKYKDDIVVTINGKNWVIQRGVQVMIPRYVYHAIENAERQKVASANHNERLMDDYNRKQQFLNK